jgi:hypothetical protein
LDYLFKRGIECRFTLIGPEFASGLAEFLNLRFLGHVMSTKIETPPYYYIAYVDEAGDPGLERVRPYDEPGASEWLVIGAVLIEASNEASPVDWTRSIIDAIGGRRRPVLHFRDLHEWQKPLACQQLAKLPVNLFTVASNKKNMRQHRNERAARASPLHPKQYFYNFCLRIILERITECVLRHSTMQYGAPRHLKAIFSRREDIPTVTPSPITNCLSVKRERALPC